MAAHRKTAIFLKYISKDDGTFFYNVNTTNTPNMLRSSTTSYSSTILQPILYVNIQTALNTFESYQIILTPDSYITPTKFDINWDPRNPYVDASDIAVAVDIIRKYNPLATAAAGITLANADAAAVAAAGAAAGEAIRVGELTRALDVAVLADVAGAGAGAETALTTAKTALDNYAKAAAADNKYIAAIISSNLNILANDTLDTNGANIQAAAAATAAEATGSAAEATGSAGGLLITEGKGVLVSIDQLPHHTAYNLRPTAADIAKLKHRLKALGNIFGNTKTITNAPPIAGGGNKSRRRKRYTQKNIIE